MREIKFRALAPVLKGKNKGRLDWFYDVLTDGVSVYIDTRFMGLQYLKDWKALSRWTGYEDSNKKDIYEHDKIKVKTALGSIKTAVVKFELGCFLVFFDALTYEPLHEVINDCEVEVIGNIYEGKHLLEDSIGGNLC